MTTCLIRRHRCRIARGVSRNGATRPGKQNRRYAILLQVSVSQIMLNELRQTLKKNRVMFAIDEGKAGRCCVLLRP